MEGQWVNRYLVEGWLDNLDQPLQHGFVAREIFRIAGAEFLYLPHVGVHFRSHKKKLTVGKRGGRGGVAGQHFQPELFQAEVFNYLWPKEGVDVGKAGKLEPWNDLLRDGASSHHIPALQHQYPQTRFGQVSGRHQAIMARPDDDGVMHEQENLRSIGENGRP